MEILLVLIILILSVIIHEMAHGYAALAQGDPTAKYAGRLNFNPMVHLDPIGSFVVPFMLFIVGTFTGGAVPIIGWAKPVPINPYNFKDQKWGEAKVAWAGPASNFVLAILFALVIRFGSDFLSNDMTAPLALVIFINLLLGLFNLIPIPPLDGSKIFFALFPQLENVRLIFERNIMLVLFLIILLSRPIFAVLNFLVTNLFYLLTGDLQPLYIMLEQILGS